MATINYNGMELEEVTIPMIFEPPMKCVVWDDELSPYEEYVLAITVEKRNPVVTVQHVFRQHCAILPDHPKPRRATRRELSKWLAQGNGERKLGSSNEPTTDMWRYNEKYENEDIGEGVVVRKWSDTEWHEPDVFYMGLEDK